MHKDSKEISFMWYLHRCFYIFKFRSKVISIIFEEKCNHKCVYFRQVAVVSSYKIWLHFEIRHEYYVTTYKINQKASTEITQRSNKTPRKHKTRTTVVNYNRQQKAIFTSV